MRLGSPAIRVSGLTKTYRGEARPVEAVRGVDFTAMCGEHVAIMGPSGSGKSTLLSIMGCLDQPDEGSYQCLGRDVLAFSVAEVAAFRHSNIGFVFQNLSLLPRMTVLENVALPFEYSDLPHQEALSRSRGALERVGLLSRAQSLPRQLSGGQQQRVAVARAIVNEPRLILADEPTGALDQESANEIISLLSSLKEQSRTIVVVTHDIEIARHADRVMLFSDGRLNT